MSCGKGAQAAHKFLIATPKCETQISTMPIAPITGTLRKRMVRDLSVATGLGIAAGYTYWFVCLDATFTANTG